MGYAPAIMSCCIIKDTKAGEGSGKVGFGYKVVLVGYAP